MRVLLLDSGRSFRGGQWQVLRLLRGLHQRGVTTLLLARSGSPLAQAARDEDLPVEGLRWATLLEKAARFDLIHAHDARAHTMATLARRPLVVSRRVAFPVGTGPLSRWKYAQPAHFIAVSHHVAGILVRAQVPSARITVVYDGVPLLPPAEPRGNSVVVAASNDPAKKASEAIAAVRLAGLSLVLSENLEKDLPSAAAMVYLSESEGLGSAILLAMSAGVPVIASDLPATREIIDHNVNGLLAAGSLQEICSALQTALHPDVHRRISLAARQTIERKFTEEQMVGNTLHVYRQVLESGHP